MASKEKASSDKVTIELTNDSSVELDTNSPDIDKLIAEIVVNREVIKPEDIKVECSDAKFDCKSFQEIVQKVVEDFVNDIAIEATAVSRARTWISERNADEADSEDAVTDDE